MLILLIKRQNLANACFPSHRGPVPFWIDTLCVPRSGAGRKKAIGTIRWIFASVRVVLALDASLLDVSTESMLQEEIGLRIMVSG